MAIYIIIFLLIVAFFFGTIRRPNNSKTLWFFIFLGLALFVGLGDMLGGYDRYIYGQLFDTMADNNIAGRSPTDSFIFVLYGNEFGYCWYNYLVSFITANRYVFILLTTLLMYFNFYNAIRKHTNNMAFATIIFMALMFFFSFTYLRQMMAAGIAWQALPYLIKRRPLPYFAIILLAITFHNSAVVMLPLYFVPVVKYKPQIIVMVLIVCLLMGVANILGGHYQDYNEIVYTGRNGGTGPLTGDAEGTFRIAYFLEALFFGGFILLNYKDIPANDKNKVLMTNIALFFCCVLLVFIKSENGGRIGWFFMIGLISTLSYLASFKRKMTNQTVVITALCFGLFLRILLAWGVLLYPYKTFFTNGHRSGDYIYQQYEYDYKYDVNKFYR